MLRFKKTSGNNCHGIELVILWILGISVVHTVAKGDHLHMGISLGPFAVSFGTSIWRKLLP